ncbi:CHP1784-containing protein [Crocosphaera subtropica ATCC 51142]|uniref:CHP1784-containing protein n=1 Tax=Crocosphaera subtropica (strain ATCC 51142 / BH68) TaxID=43989 RepID=B1WZ75_CROS5|nr:Rpn family recombination-promoting nuclease/putative transposase [Crocosphaera subtropica]ACB49441.1 CHP1784-containing protein [Crocosphaera subtropica ATCC 51142]
MKTDTIFYRLFQSFPSIFFELIQVPVTQADNYRFDSVEVKQLAFRIDGVFLPKNNNLDSPIYFCELQFQKDDQFYERFFAEIFLYLSKTELNNDWQGVIIYPNRQIETQQTQRYQEVLNSPRITRIYLDELANLNQTSIGLATIKLITLPSAETIENTRQLIQRVKGEFNPDQKPQELLQLIETILVYKLPRLSRQKVEAMFSLDELKQTQYFQDVREEAKLEGIQEGELRAKITSVPSLLALGLTVEQVAEALKLDIEQVRLIQNNNEQGADQ